MPPRRFRSLLWRTPVDREIDEELAFHLEMREREYLERGMTPEAARAAARARLGDLGPVRAECHRLARDRDRRLDRAESLAELRQDLRLAARRLAASPLLCALAVGTLALSLALAASAFAAFDALVLRPLPFPHPERLVRLREIGPEGGDLAVSPPAFLAWRSAAGHVDSAVAAIAAIVPGDRAVDLPGGRERVAGVAATAALFPLLRLHPERGRLLAAGDEARGGERRVAVLSHRLWLRLGGRWNVVGQVLSLDGVPHTVVGVLPADAAFPPGAELWTPLVIDPRPARRGSRHELAVVARLAPGASPGAAARSLGARAAPLAEWAVGEGARSRSLLVLAAALLLALLSGCGVASLLASRAAARGRELGLRAALGASRGRILRQLATEGALVALSAAALAPALAAAMLALVRERFAALAAGLDGGFAAGLDSRFAGWPHSGFAGWSDSGFAAGRLAGLALDGRSLAFLAASAAALALLAVVAPAAASARVDLPGAARGAPLPGARRASRGRWLRAALVTLEIAAATAILTATGLAARSLRALAAVDPGFAPGQVLAAELELGGDRYPSAARRTLQRALEARLAHLPGVVAVGSTSFAPWSGERPDPPYLAACEGCRRPLAADLRSVSPGFFRALGLPLAAGRPPDGDRDLPEVAVDRSLARRAWPAGDGLGRRLTLGSPPKVYTVVGIAGEIADGAPGEPPRPTVFVPYPRRPWRTLTLLVRTAGDPEATAGAVRREIAAAAPGLASPRVRPLALGLAAAMAGPRASLLLLALFAVLALPLAATGVYDLLASGVGERAPEIAVRLALGATPGGVAALVLRRAAGLAAAGLTAGLAAAAALARSLPAVLYGTSPADAAAFSAAALLLAAAAMTAGLPPARRAARIDPAAALAGE